LGVRSKLSTVLKIYIAKTPMGRNKNKRITLKLTTSNTLILIKIFNTFLLFFLVKMSFAQVEKQVTHRFGATWVYDEAYNNPDKLITAGIGRKGTVGVTYTNKKREFLAFFTGGFKGAKINFYSPKLQDSFLDDVSNNYSPIIGNKTDSLIGASVINLKNKVPDYSFEGTYAQFLQVGFMLNKYKLKPMISFYTGREQYLLFSKLLRGTNPKDYDYRYGTMGTTFKEIKLGVNVPLKYFADKPFCININAGYKWGSYGAIQFEKAPLSAYTNNNLASKYNTFGKFTASISFIIWSNWGM
jgi:hypothetical protein